MKRWANVCLSLLIALAVIGYLVGIGDGVPTPDAASESWLIDAGSGRVSTQDSKLIPALSYADIANASLGPTKRWQATPQKLPPAEYDLHAQIQPTEADKEASTKLRASRRAYNGAPPIIPHPVENTTDAACYACHAGGVQLAGVKASVMSHPYLANCQQCHAPMAPAPFQSLDASVDSSFVGLPAPRAGRRAYPGAPPTIPHSRWMRENCNACHGGPHGWAGMESTHPWRTNCVQCHAPSATLDQMPESESVPMLPPLDVVAN